MTKKTVQTIEDIARLAQVSKSTVSRALNDSPLISTGTKDRIQAIAAEHDFCINIPARQLSRQRTNTIAFATHAYHTDFTVADLFLLEIMGGIFRGLRENGYDLLVMDINPNETDWIHQYLDAHRVDGFILMTSSRKQSHIKAMVEMGAPFIVWGTANPNLCYCSVTGDSLSGGRLATEHLIRTGRQKIAFLGGPVEEIEVKNRFAGYEAALKAAGRNVEPGLITYGDFYTSSSGAAAMRRLLKQAPDLDAVFVNSDLMAIAALETIRQSGRRVPEDIAVVGYDDLSVAAINNPPLTTIRQNIPLAGKMLATNLIQYLQNGAVSNVTLPVELVIRKTA